MRRPSESPRPPVWADLLAMTGIFLGATLAAILCGTAIMALAPKTEYMAMATTIYAVQFLLAITGILIYLGRLGRKRLLRFRPGWSNAPFALGGIILVTASGILLEPVLSLFPEGYFDKLEGMLGSGGWTVLLTVVLAPVFEEILFRGILLESLLGRMKSWQAVAVSALLFGLVHASIPPQMVNAIVVGLVLGYIYVLTRSLIPVIMVHALNNGIAYLLLEITGTQATDTRQIIGNDTVYWIVFGASAVIVAASLALMWVFAEKKNTKRYETPFHEEITNDDSQI
jgi:membrane protease YdiL (CAAX protease family)